MNIVRVLKKGAFRLYRILLLKKRVYCKMGKNNRFGRYVFLHEKTRIGDNNYFGDFSMTLNSVIGNYNSIGPGVKIGQMEHDLKCVSTNTLIFGSHHGITEFNGYKSPAVIENDVWIAANAVIKQGVTCHTGAVIGANAVVTKDVPPYAIVGGVPAEIIRYRFSEEDIQTLLSSEWWEKGSEMAVEYCKSLQRKME